MRKQKEWFEEGYLSAMKDILNYKIDFENNSIDAIIIDMGLKKSEFLKYWDESELDFVDEKYLSSDALEVWSR